MPAAAPFSRLLGILLAHGVASATQCQPGAVPTGNGLVCSECQAGRFAADGDQVCTECAAGKYTDIPGQTACTACRLTGGFFAHATGTQICLPCPVNALCEPDANGLYTGYVAAPGMYLLDGPDLRDKFHPLGTIYKCTHGENGKACRGRNECLIDEESGEAAMEGPMCGKCRPGFAKGTPLDHCTKCPSIFLTVIVSMVNFFFLFVLWAFLCIVTLGTDAARPKQMHSIVLRQVVSYVQNTTIVMSLVTLQMPSGLQPKHLLKPLQGLFGGGNLFETAMDCFGQSFGLREMEAGLMLGWAWVPLWLCMCTVVFFFFSHVVLVAMGCRKFAAHKVVAAYVISIFVVLPRVTRLFVGVIDCRAFDKLRLVKSLDVICFSADHAPAVTLALLGIAVYSFGIPLLLFLVLKKYHRANRLREAKVMDMLGFLYNGFEPNYYWFEPLLMVRKVMFQLSVNVPGLTAVPIAALSHGTEQIQVSCMLVVAVGFLMIHYLCEPYDDRSYFLLDHIESSFLWAVLGTLLVQNWVSTTDVSYFFYESKGAIELRDIIAIIIITALHARFWWLVVSGLVFTALRSCTNSSNKLFRDRKVTVLADGVRTKDLSSREQELYLSVVNELGRRCLDEQPVFRYGTLDIALQRLCMQACYRRKDPRSSLNQAATRRLEAFRQAMEKTGSQGTLSTSRFERMLKTVRALQQSEQPGAEEDAGLDFSRDKYANVVGETCTVNDLYVALLRCRSTVLAPEEPEQEPRSLPGASAQQRLDKLMEPQQKPYFEDQPEQDEPQVEVQVEIEPPPAPVGQRLRGFTLTEAGLFGPDATGKFGRPRQEEDVVGASRAAGLSDEEADAFQPSGNDELRGETPGGGVLDMGALLQDIPLPSDFKVE